MQVYEDLKDDLLEISNLSGINALLSWDQETYMPESALDGRSSQIALISKLQHEKLKSNEFKQKLSKWIDLKTGEVNLALDNSTKKMLGLIYKDYQKNNLIPDKFVTEYSTLKSQSQYYWQQARQQDDYTVFLPYLEKIIDYSKQYAQYIDSHSDPYNILIDEHEPEMTYQQIDQIFTPLQQQLTTFLSKIPKHSNEYSLRTPLEEQQQWDYGISVLERIGFDFKTGRQDKSVHPFTTMCDYRDVRITTRFDAFDFLEGFSSTVHEGGHALYEQGLNKNFLGSPFSEATSMGIHESQSRFWEHFICKSKPFWNSEFSRLKTFFPNHFQDIDLKTFYKWINQIKPSLIRVAADEVTYNLHIIIRFECEKAIFSNQITAADLPAFWNEKYQQYLGVTPQSDKDGVLQDVHWSIGAFGYFPTYTLGNLFAAQLMEMLKEVFPDLDTKIEKNDFDPILQWLKINIFDVGRKQNSIALIESVTKRRFSESFFMNYLYDKYSEIFQIDLQ